MSEAALNEAPRLSLGDVDVRQKRLGQYHSGPRVAGLLNRLAESERADSVVDPMAGIGDMLVECAAEAGVVAAIEIDPIADAVCRERLGALAPGRVKAVRGNAFSLEVLGQLPSLEWDLVITNPPYVRYQEGGASASFDGMSLPSASDVRRDLIGALEVLPAIEKERRDFLELARDYSGLSDLAVPSWILCAALVRAGGTLAMVAPNAWLSRDYASAIRSLLGRWFETEVVVEDTDACWFRDALVRTTLLVARRREGRAGYPHIRVSGAAGNDKSVVGNAYASSSNPDGDFAEDVRRWRAQRRVGSRPFMSAHWVRVSHVNQRAREWESSGAREPRTTVYVPELLLGSADRGMRFASLGDLGWKVGQGLRTGANDFFYVDHVEPRGRDQEVVATSTLFDRRRLVVPTDALAPVVRRQGELPTGWVVEPVKIKGRVLLLNGYALPEDRAGSASTGYRALPPELADHVRAAAIVNMGTENDRKTIPELSAVMTNRRAARDGTAPKFWYQLPMLVRRHRPEILVPRINQGAPKALLNGGGRCVIDANFSTLWPERSDGLDLFALIAALNSSWTKSLLELSATVLGGGALKVEAAHLRRLPLPAFGAREWAELSQLGGQLCMTEVADLTGVSTRIDDAMERALFGNGGRAGRLARVSHIAQHHQAMRSRARSSRGAGNPLAQA